MSAGIVALIVDIVVGHRVFELPPTKPTIVHRDPKPPIDDRDCDEILDEDDSEDCED